jgi:2-hydroxy-4-carboxymuconate semialdehyde hemiacetal dehydrogenase
MRVALIGYGAVAAIHARALSKSAEFVAVCGPDEKKAEAFARLHDIPHADTQLERALARSEAAIITSPTPLHFHQAVDTLKSGVNVLIELPACASPLEAETLSALAISNQLELQCAHTSRYLEPYRRMEPWIQSGALGEIRHVHYIRSMTPRQRSWVDDALLHHAQHPLDLFLHWFGSVQPLGCAAHPGVPGAQDLSLLASIYDKVPVTISISYSSRLPELKMTIIGTEHTIATDGFTYIASDEPGFRWQGDEQRVYETAIEEQDMAFLNACYSGNGGIPWTETMNLTRCVQAFAVAANQGHHSNPCARR